MSSDEALFKQTTRWHQLKQFREKVARAGGLSVFATDDEIVEWVATLYLCWNPSAKAMKVGLDAVERAMEGRPAGWLPEVGAVSFKVAEARRAQEREVVADEICKAYDASSDSEPLKSVVLRVLESCDDPGAYDRIPGEEDEKPVRMFVDPSDLPDRLLDPAFPGEVALRDQPAWTVTPEDVGARPVSLPPTPPEPKRWSGGDKGIQAQRAATPDLLEAAEAVLARVGVPELENLRRAVEAEKKRQAGQVNAATALLSNLT